MKKFLSILSVAFLLTGMASSSAFALWGDETTTNANGEEVNPDEATLSDDTGEARVRAIQLLAKNPDAFTTATKVARQMSAARQQN